MPDFSTIQMAVANVLREHPSLRSLDGREKVWLKVKQIYPKAKFSTVERICRKLQNEWGLYLPEKMDKRYENEAKYRCFFAKNV